MKLSKRLLIFFTLLVLTGCSVLLTSERDLIDKNIVKSFCSDQNITQVITKVEKRMDQCYVGSNDQTHYVNGAVFSTKTSNRVTKEVGKDGVVSFAFSMQPAMNSRYYLFRVQLESTKASGCPVKVTTHLVTPIWSRHSINLEKWVSGERINCEKI